MLSHLGHEFYCGICWICANECRTIPADTLSKEFLEELQAACDVSHSWKFRVSIMLNSSLYYNVVYFLGPNSYEVAMRFAHFCWARCPESVYKGSCALLCKLLIFSNLGLLPTLIFYRRIHNLRYNCVRLTWQCFFFFFFQEDRVVLDEDERRVHGKSWNTYHTVKAFPEVVVHPK